MSDDTINPDEFFGDAPIVLSAIEVLDDAPDDAPPGEPPVVAPHVSTQLDAPSLQASLSAIGTVHTEQFEAVGSAVGFASVDGDATITASASPIVHAKGDIHVRQAYTSAVVAGGTVDMSQSLAPIIVGKKLSVNQGGGVVMLAGEAKVKNGFVGVLLAPSATVSEDSRVLLSTAGALIIAAALLGGFAIVAAVMVIGARRILSWRPAVHMPDVHVPAMPDFAAMAEKIRKYAA